MPLVIMKYDPKKVPTEVMSRLAQHIPKIIASSLCVENDEAAHLSPKDIEVWVKQANDLDVNVKDIEMVVFAGRYAGRLETIEARKKRIKKFVKKFLASAIPNGASITGYVWVLLADGAFGEL